MQKKRVFLVIVCLGLMAALAVRASAVVTAQTQSASVSFKTPEDAITFFIQGVSQNDVNKILQACAIDEIGEKFKFDLYEARIQAFVPNQSPAPSDYPFYAAINKTQKSWEILSQVRMFAFSLLSTENMVDGSLIMMDADKAAKFQKEVDPTRLSQLTVKKIGLPNKKSMDTPKYLDVATKLAHVYGADEYTERVALVQFEGNFYPEGFTLLRYGENWKISNANSPISGIVASGATQKIAESDFDNMFH